MATTYPGNYTQYVAAKVRWETCDGDTRAVLYWHCRACRPTVQRLYSATCVSRHFPPYCSRMVTAHRAQVPCVLYMMLR